MSMFALLLVLFFGCLLGASTCLQLGKSMSFLRCSNLRFVLVLCLLLLFAVRFRFVFHLGLGLCFSLSSCLWLCLLFLLWICFGLSLDLSSLLCLDESACSFGGLCLSVCCRLLFNICLCLLIGLHLLLTHRTRLDSLLDFWLYTGLCLWLLLYLCFLLCLCFLLNASSSLFRGFSGSLGGCCRFLLDGIALLRLLLLVSLLGLWWFLTLFCVALFVCFVLILSLLLLGLCRRLYGSETLEAIGLRLLNGSVGTVYC